MASAVAEGGGDSHQVKQDDQPSLAPSRKHDADEAHDADGEAPPSKHPRVDGPVTQKITVTEAEVGINAYVNADLQPIQGGIIKQRFSDFHVREVTKKGDVCHITSLLPPTKEQGGSGLLERIQAEEAERADSSGQLRKTRLEQEAAAKAKVKAEEEAEKASQSFTWDFDEEQLGQIKALLPDEQAVAALQKLWTSGPDRRSGQSVMSRAISSKEERTSAHQLVRQLFSGYLATETVEIDQTSQDGGKASAIRIRWGSGRPERRAPVRKDADESIAAFANSPYILFLLQKTNRDSQDALNILARSLGLLHPVGGGGPGRGGSFAASKAVKELSVAGTKDKRGITVQQVALKRGRKTLDDVWRLANGLKRHDGGGGSGGKRQRTPFDVVHARGDRGLRIAHLQYADAPLHLGETNGNEFEIVLRNVKVQSRKSVDEAMHVLQTKGFVNYFGMQRFGTSAVSTHRVGIALLRNDYRHAIELIMMPRDNDQSSVQEARTAFQNGQFEKSLSLFPHNNVPERSILQRMRPDRMTFIEGQSPFATQGVDWKKYFSALPRTLRTMYVHAYQSYAWNTIATERVKRFGVQSPVIGDYVLLSNGDDETQSGYGNGTDGIADNDDEIMISLSSAPRKRVKLLETDEDVKQHSIHDVVIPMPGTEVRFPEASWMHEVYRETLARDGLTPEDVERTGQRSAELILTGDYRALLHLPKNVRYDLVRYADPDVNLIQADEDKLLGLDSLPARVPFNDAQTDEEREQYPFVALIVCFALGTSAYATMALREILKQETSSAHQKDLTMKGEDRMR